MHAERNPRINLTQYTRLRVLVRFKDVLAGLFRVLEGRYGIRGHAGIQKMRMRVPSEHVARIGDVSTNQNVREQLVIVGRLVMDNDFSVSRFFDGGIAFSHNVPMAKRDLRFR